MNFVLVRLAKKKKKVARWQVSTIKRGLNLTMGFSEEDLRSETQDRHFMQTIQTTLLQQCRGKTQLQHCLGALCTKTYVGRSVLCQNARNMLNYAKSFSEKK